MISLSRAEVPQYLRRSKFCQALEEDDSTEFSIPQECFKANATVHSSAECMNLLRTLNFRMVDEPQRSLMMHILTTNVSVFEKKDSEERKLLMSLKFGPEYLQLKKTDYHDRMAFATRSGMGLTIVEALSTLLADIPENLCSVAAEVGDLDVLKFSRNHQCKWGDAAQLAVSNGHVECVQYAMNHNDLLTVAVEKGQLSSLKALHASGAVLDDSLCLHAAYHGQLRCLQYLHENGAHWDEKTIKKAIKSWNNDCLLYAHRNGCPVSRDATQHACKHDNYAALHYLIKQDVPVSPYSAFMAVTYGRLLCLKYAHRLGARWYRNITSIACFLGRFECLRYAIEHDCPWEEQSGMETCLNHCHISCWLYLLLRSIHSPFDVLFNREMWFNVISDSIVVLVVQYLRGGSVTIAGLSCVPVALEFVRNVLLTYPVQVEHCFPQVGAYKCTMYIYVLTIMMRFLFKIWVVGVVLYALCWWCWACVAGFFFG